MSDLEALVTSKWYELNYHGKTYHLTNTKVRFFLRAVTAIGGFEAITKLEQSDDPSVALDILPKLTYHIAIQNAEFVKDWPIEADFLDSVEFDDLNTCGEVFQWAFSALQNINDGGSEKSKDNFQSQKS